ncbi:ABC transporter substrate-binding protein [Nocardioides baekrokdamisoli]|uniref:ABC transporter substrate-binding protein n=1 Tax=Nocardioides baekrokdamisoli TaxID=1804624 RepID=A0A3G9IK89_9ACTN|nr:ABC transporter substrate-binding protein [Nocardioides baekrokdamisoli]BBH16485.1 ABC transporter substrate-binding protein [Nocardioides baekrokdamisoli]
MRVINVRRIGVAALGGTLAVSLAACGSTNNSSSNSSSAANGGAWASATSATAGGGMDALIAAAKKEGSLNVITLPRNWANYGELMDNFTKKYGIKINDSNPDGSSADEITAIKTLKGQDRAPDVVDVGMPFAYSGTKEGDFAPYQVATWNDIPAAAKDPNGNWFNDYGGVMSIGCDAKRVSVCPTSFKQLDNPMYKGMVALKDDPSQANAALMGVAAVALAKGGTLDNIQPGIDYFGKLKKDGIFKPIKATESTVETGATPILLFWDYLNASYGKDTAAKGVQWKVAVPSDSPVLAGYYAQAINANAPHPAAARLWEEYLFSVEGQNGFLKGGAHPVQQAAMTAAGTIDKTLLAALPVVTGTPVLPNEAQNTTIGNQVSAGWAKALG